MSSKIIQMCCQDISLDRIFEGYVVSSRQSLHDCISCMNAWKDCYLYAAQMHNRWAVGQLSVCALQNQREDVKGMQQLVKEPRLATPLYSPKMGTTWVLAGWSSPSLLQPCCQTPLGRRKEFGLCALFSSWYLCPDCQTVGQRHPAH